MLSRLVIAVGFTLLVGSPARALDKDYLQRGEETLTGAYQIAYDRAVRRVLSRAWEPDVVLRMLDIPPFEPERAVGLSRTAAGYRAFRVTAPKSIWHSGGFGADERKPPKGISYRRFRAISSERPLRGATAERVVALWRRVLTNSRNYGADPSVHTDSNEFTFSLAVRPRERFTARITGWGPETLRLITVAGALFAYADGTYSERQLEDEIAKAEKKIGI